MGFPSPAADYAESRISLDQQIIRHPSATYFMRAADSHHREGILQGALLVVDSSLPRLMVLCLYALWMGNIA